MGKIKVAIAGVGNCASSLVQGVYYYKNKNPDDDDITGLMHWEINGYKPSDIEFVSAFDIDLRKVGKNLSDAIYSEPNCTTQFYNVPKIGTKVKMGRILDGFAKHMINYDEKCRFVISDEKESTMQKVVDELKSSEAEILLNYLPVGSEEGARFYAGCALNAGTGFINCIPVFIASDEEWADKFRYKGLPIIGDDIKSQLGATIVHRTLTDLFKKRGVKL
ncbi:unnamed protein product, partial [marine sediment metagenome]